MVYKQLLISTGGGVITNDQKDEQNDHCATLAIGLGGTGVSCLRSLKQQVYSQIQADAGSTEDMPVYSHIKFLAVDADKNSLSQDNQLIALDETTEFFSIATDNIEKLLKQVTVLSTKPEFRWLKNADDEKGTQGLKILSATAGAGGVRQIGRLLLIQKSKEFVDRVENLISEAKKGLPGGSDVNVHIFTGLGGGTGSGTFLDVCYLVQRALENIGEGGHALTCGYVFLPDVNLSVPEVAASPVISRFIRANSFAAMKELDYCMNFENNRGSWDQIYSGFTLSGIKEPPVKICHLISAATTSGAQLEDGYGYAMNVVTDFVMQFLVENDINMQTHIANYARAMGGVSRQHGANYNYCLLGAARATVPMREIATYLSSCLFGRMARIQNIQPSDQAVEEFVKHQGLTYSALLKSIQNGFGYSSMPMFEMDPAVIPPMTESDLGTPELILPDVLLGPFRSAQRRLFGSVQGNMEALTHDWSPAMLREEKDNISKVCSCYYALSTVVKDPARGPFYAQAMLGGTGRQNILDYLRNALRQTSRELKNTEADAPLRMDEVKSARTAYLHPRFLANKKKLLTGLIEALRNYYVNDSKIYVLRQQEVMINRMIEQFSKLHRNCFLVYAYVMKNLIDTFRENYRVLNSTIAEQVVKDPFEMPLMTVKDLKPSLDAAVASMNLDDVLRDFDTELFDHPEVWMKSDEARLCGTVRTFLTKRFAGYTGRTLTDYLQMRFNETDPGRLADRTYREILMKLNDKAEPLFWLSNAFQISEASPIGYCSIPSDAAAITAAAASLCRAHPELQRITGKLTDRIFLLRCTCGVPLFAYTGISTGKATYLNDRSVGKHLYERTDRDERDWRRLEDLVPYSMLEKDERTEEQEKAAEDYDMAVKAGLIRLVPGTETDWQMVGYPSADAVLEQANQALQNPDADSVIAAANALDSFMENLEPDRFYAISNDGAAGYEELVRRDHVLGSAFCMEHLRSELDKMEKLVKAKADLEQAMKSLESSIELSEVFRNAMYTGVFVFAPPNITYVKEDPYGISEDIPLSTPKMTPYGALVPLYQAFVTFCSLDSGTRKEISSACLERMSSGDSAALEASCDRLIKLLSPAYMKVMQNQMAKVPSEAPKIRKFLLDLRAGLDDFRMMYGLL